jgi:excisionase family DNA binding protein
MATTSSHTAPTSPERLLRVDEVAAVLGIDPRTVKRLARAGELRRVVLGHRTTRYRASDLEALIAERTRSQHDPSPAGKPGSVSSTDAAGPRGDVYGGS